MFLTPEGVKQWLHIVEHETDHPPAQSIIGRPLGTTLVQEHGFLNKNWLVLPEKSTFPQKVFAYALLKLHRVDFVSREPYKGKNIYSFDASKVFSE